MKLPKECKKCGKNISKYPFIAVEAPRRMKGNYHEKCSPISEII